MTKDHILRLLRGTFRNSIVWGVAWFLFGLALLPMTAIIGEAPDTLLGALALPAKVGGWGALAGGAFSLIIGLALRGRRLADLSAARFALGGAFVGGVAVHAALQLISFFSGSGFVPIWQIIDTTVWSAVFGGVAAGGSIKLAQRAERAESRLGEPIPRARPAP